MELKVNPLRHSFETGIATEMTVKQPFYLVNYTKSATNERHD